MFLFIFVFFFSFRFSIFQVRKDAARPRKLEALSAAREATYSRYTDVYKGDAADAYARAVEASLRKRGGVEAYRRRVVAASLDAERYRGFHETPAASSPAELEREEGGASLADAGRHNRGFQATPAACFSPVGSTDSGPGFGSSSGGGGISLTSSSSAVSSRHNDGPGGTKAKIAETAAVIPKDKEIEQHEGGGGGGGGGERGGGAEEGGRGGEEGRGGKGERKEKQEEEQKKPEELEEQEEQEK